MIGGGGGGVTTGHIYYFNKVLLNIHTVIHVVK